MKNMKEEFMPPATKKEKELIDELRNSFAELSDLNESEQGENRWLENIRRLNELVLSEDPRDFLQWDVIKRTMEVGNAEFIETELDFIKNQQDWRRWEKAICDVSIGNPTLSNVYPASSGNLIHYAYHVAQFENMTSENINDLDCIFEFGGGYGGMYRLIHNLGFKGKYIIFDFPAFSALQQYFIKSIGLEAHTVDSFKQAKSGVICVSDFHVLQDLLLNHVPATNSMFLASWSLSECPVDLRNEILPMVTNFKGFLIAYQGQFEGTDNIEFFNDWKGNQLGINWCDKQIEHIPNDFYRNNFYLMGNRKN